MMMRSENAMKVDLEGKTVIVTGASSGIGQASVKLLAESGATVIGVARRSISSDSPRVRSLAVDLSEPGSTAAIIEEATRDGALIDGILFAAGQFTSATVADGSLEDLDDLWNVHVRSPFAVTQAAVPHLSDGASIVFVSSTVARVGFAPFAAYSAVKGAVDSLSRSLAIELAPKVRVNTLMPGFTQTSMMTVQYADAPDLEPGIIQRTPLGFIGGPEYAANIVALLMSRDTAYTTASTFVVDGGWSGQGWQSL
jgi:3-oxoacyl-[acyl-carrier protein] reductase